MSQCRFTVPASRDLEDIVDYSGYRDLEALFSGQDVE